MTDDPKEIAKSLADQVENWYNGGKKKRDEITTKLKELGHTALAQEIVTWYSKGDKRFKPLINRLRNFSN